MKIPPEVLEEVKKYYIGKSGMLIDYRGIKRSKKHKCNNHVFVLRIDYANHFTELVFTIDDALMEVLLGDLTKFIIEELSIAEECIKNAQEGL